MDPSLLLTGIVIGLAVTAPLGPVNILVIRNAIRRGFGVAFLVGLGAVLADVLYAAAAAYGVKWVSTLIADYAEPLLILGGLLLVVMGIWLARKHVHLTAIEGEEKPGAARIIGKMLTAFGLTITNPGEFFGFLAIFGTMNAVLRLHEGADRPPTVIIGVALGGMLWWLLLGFLVSRFRSRISDRALDRINHWTGVLIAAFGFALLMEALF